MNQLLSFSLAILLSVFALNTHAIVNGHEYQFDEDGKAEIFKKLANELRCPKCQNQNLADSNAMIADDLRRELYQQVQQGKGSQEIVDFMVNRYGEFVLYRPKVNAMTYVLWYGPAALCVIAALAFGLVMRQRRKNEAVDSSNVGTSSAQTQDSVSETDDSFSAEEQAKLNRLLESDQSDSDSKKGS